MKKYAFGIGALVLAVGMSSFGLRPTTTQLYRLDGSQSEKLDPEAYTPISTSLCPTQLNSNWCEVEAEPIVGGSQNGLPNFQEEYIVHYRAN